MHCCPESAAAARYELRFVSLFDAGRGYAFPCDADGDVDLARLSERGRASFQSARGAVGRDLCAPVIVAALRH